MYGKSEKIGIFGGSFNPIHNGHMRIVEAAVRSFDLDHVLFVPNPNPPHKAGEAMPSGDIRARMTARAIAGIPKYGLSTYELRRGHDCYTYYTLGHFREKYPEDELYFIMGADSLKTFPQWRYPAVISSLAVLCVACREDLADAELRKLISEMARRYHADIRLIPCSGIDVSSTQLREMAAGGEAFDDLVPSGVADLIRANRLYLPEEETGETGEE